MGRMLQFDFNPAGNLDKENKLQAEADNELLAKLKKELKDEDTYDKANSEKWFYENRRYGGPNRHIHMCNFLSMVDEASEDMLEQILHFKIKYANTLVEVAEN